MRILDCPECDWKTKPKHKRPKLALRMHCKAAHPGQVSFGSFDDYKKGKIGGPGPRACLGEPQNGATVEPGTYHEQLEVGENTDTRARPGFLVTLLDGKQHFVPAEEHQETQDRHWFFRGGALKETFKRNAVAAVEVA